MTQQIKQINILDMMKMYGEVSCKTVLSTFMRPLNLDVEDLYIIKRLNLPDSGLPLHSLFSRNVKAVLPLLNIIPLPTNLYQ